MAPKPDLKAEGKELAQILADARKKPLNFAMLVGSDGLVVKADKIKSVDAMRKAAKAAGGGAKGCWGTMVAEGKTLLLSCETDPPGNLPKLAQRHFSDRGQTVRVKLQGDDDGEDAQSKNTADEDEAHQAGPVTTDADDETYEADPENPDDEDDIAAQNGDLSALIKAARKRPYSFACMISDAGVVLVGHPRKPPTVLVRQAKAEGGSAKGGWGTLTMEAKFMVLSCVEDPPSSLARRTKMHLRTVGLKYGVILRSPSGEIVESDEDVVEAAAKTAGPDAPAGEMPELGYDPNAPRDLDPKAMMARYGAVMKSLKTVLLPEEGPQMKVILAKFAMAMKSGKTDEADYILWTFEKRIAGDLLPLANLKTGNVIDAEHQAMVSDSLAMQPEEVARLEAWISANYMAEENELGLSLKSGLTLKDEVGGDRLAEALKGRSTLGPLTKDQQQYLATRVVRKWVYAPQEGEDGAAENIEEFTAAMAKEPEFAGKIAGLYWNTYAQNNQFTEGKRDEGYEQRDLSLRLLENMIDLNPTESTKALAGYIGGKGLAEWATGWRKKEALPGSNIALKDFYEPYFDKISAKRRHTLMTEVTNGALSVEESDQFMSFMFGSTAEYDVEDKAEQDTWAYALSTTLARNNCFTDGPRKEIETRLKEVLAKDGGRQLLFGHSIDAPMRNWALNQMSPSPVDPSVVPWEASQLSEGWESDVVGQAFAKKGLEQARAQFPTPVSFSMATQKDLLANTFGQTFGLPPTLTPKKNETPEEMEARLAAGANHPYYKTDEAPVSNFFNFLKEQEDKGQKIDPAQITPIPITFMSNELGTAVFKVIRLETPNGPVFFDHRNNRYSSAKHWADNNKLPPGKVTFPEDLVLGNPPVSQITPADTTVAWIWDKLDTAAMIAGTIAGVAVIIGSGGTAAPIVAGAAAVYGGARAGMALDEKSELGHDIGDLSDPEIRGLWLDAGSSVLSIGAIGGGMRAAKLIQQGGKMSRAGASVVAGMTMTGNLVDAVAMGDAVYTLSKSWDKMTPEQKTKALLSLSFQFGMQAASAKSNGGRFADSFDFKRTRNQLEFGTPFDVKPLNKGDTSLQPGQVAVKYDPPTEKNPHPSNFRIVYGGDTPPSRFAIELHSQTASAMEASVNMQKRYGKLVDDGKKPEPGSAPWEAQFELTKIQTEAGHVMDQLNSGSIDADARARLQSRMDELNAALVVEKERLDAWEVMAKTEKGRGLVASPSGGESQRLANGWPDPPKGHHWVASPDNKPFLRRDKKGTERWFWDEAKSEFVLYADRPDATMRVVGHGDNEMSFMQRGDGKTAEAHATLRKFHINAERSADELAAQKEIGGKGTDTDDAGHVIGHRFGLDQGMENMFPQDSNFNRGAYKKMENEFADWIAAGGEVRISATIDKFVGDRPDRVSIRYQVVNPATGDVVYARSKVFSNDGEQFFKRIENTDINARMAANNTGAP